MRKILIGGVVVALGAGALFLLLGRPNTQLEEPPQGTEQPIAEKNEVVLPIAEYADRRTVNAFGERSQVSIEGYHVADDIEYTDVLAQEVPVFAIADGIVRRMENVSGYGGAAVLLHEIGGEPYGAIYGHIDVSSADLKVGDRVKAGQFLANLGDHESEETSGERKHLHFGLYEGGEMRVHGYEQEAQDARNWLNPSGFFESYGYSMESPVRVFDAAQEPGGDTYQLEFSILPGWEVEYVRELDALNLFTLSGEGTARERSEVFIGHFDAFDFLTLSTVTIHGVRDTTVGPEQYTARVYDIEKKQEAAPFENQPEWRNARHTAIDFRGEAGFTRYYSVAASPSLDQQTFDTIVQSMNIID